MTSVRSERPIASAELPVRPRSGDVIYARFPSSDDCPDGVHFQTRERIRHPGFPLDAPDVIHRVGRQYLVTDREFEGKSTIPISETRASLEGT